MKDCHECGQRCRWRFYAPREEYSVPRWLLWMHLCERSTRPWGYCDSIKLEEHSSYDIYTDSDNIFTSKDNNIRVVNIPFNKLVKRSIGYCMPQWPCSTFWYTQYMIAFSLAELHSAWSLNMSEAIGNQPKAVSCSQLCHVALMTPSSSANISYVLYRPRRTILPEIFISVERLTFLVTIKSKIASSSRPERSTCPTVSGQN